MRFSFCFRSLFNPNFKSHLLHGQKKKRNDNVSALWSISARWNHKPQTLKVWLHQNSRTQGTARYTDTAKEHTTIFQSARDDGGDIFIAEK